MDISFTIVNGELRAIYSDEVAAVFKKLGITDFNIQRVSHVEPCGMQWTADMKPVNGPVLGPFDTKAEALAAEEAWINKHVLSTT